MPATRNNLHQATEKNSYLDHPITAETEREGSQGWRRRVPELSRLYTPCGLQRKDDLNAIFHPVHPISHTRYLCITSSMIPSWYWLKHARQAAGLVYASLEWLFSGGDIGRHPPYLYILQIRLVINIIDRSRDQRGEVPLLLCSIFVFPPQHISVC